MDAPTIVAIFVGLGGFITGFWAIRKVNAESDSLVVTSAEKVVELVNNQLEQSEKRREAVKKEFAEAKAMWEEEKIKLRGTIANHEARIRKLEEYCREKGFDPDEVNGS